MSSTMKKITLLLLLTITYSLASVAAEQDSKAFVKFVNPQSPETTNLTNSDREYILAGRGLASCQRVRQDENPYSFRFSFLDPKTGDTFRDALIVSPELAKPIVPGQLIAFGSPGNLIQANGRRWFVKMNLTVLSINSQQIMLAYDSKSNPKQVFGAVAFAESGGAAGRAVAETVRLEIRCQ